MYAYQATLAEQEELELKKKEYERKSKLREELFKQIEFSKKMANEERIADTQYAKNVIKDVEAYKNQEDLKMKIIHEKAEIQRKFREEQIMDQKRRREEEHNQLLKHEKENLDACQRAIEREQQLITEKKQNEIERQKRILEENEELRKYRLEQKQIDGEYDRKLMREYAEKMDREAEERENAFSKRLAALEAFAKKFTNEGAGKVEKEERLREERLLLEEQERKEKADKAEELRRKELARKRQQDAAKANLNMIKEQQLRSKIEKETDQKLIALAEADLAKWRKDEELRLRKLAENKIRFRTVLQTQMDEKHHCSKLSDMTDMEYIINKQVIKNIEESDEKTQKEIKKRLQLQ